MLNKHVAGFECAAVREVGFDDNAVMQSNLFVRLFGANSFNRREPELMLNMKETRTMINKDAAALVS
jgi:hypothetical protein